MTTKNNKRIRELADEAAKYSAVMALPTGQSGNELFVEKFAELIVRECCDIFVELRTRPADLAVKDVKQHFGVE